MMMDALGPNPLLPLLPIVAAVVVALIDAAWRRDRSDARWIVVAGLLASLTLLVVTPVSSIPDESGLRLDEFRVLVLGSILVAGLVVQSFTPFAGRPVLRTRSAPELLLLLGILGAAVVVMAGRFPVLFLGLELLGLSASGLVVTTGPEPRSIEAGIKYLLLSGASSATLVFGLGLVYLATGSLEVSGLLEVADGAGLAGLGLVLVGVAFKVGAVPFHWWVADVYAGSPDSATTFLATISKASVFGFLVAVFGDPSAPAPAEALRTLVGALAIASMLVGNLLALHQNDLKRLVAYSSIAHAGYLLIAVVADSPLVRDAVSFYLAAYVASVAIVFGVTRLAGTTNLNDLRGLALERPFVGGSLVVGMLNLAGIPPVAGFVAKLRLVQAGVEGGAWVLVSVLVLTSILALVYYLRVVLVVLLPGSRGPRPETALLPATALSLVLLTVLTFVLGVWPSLLLAAPGLE